jgi:hypothetical protein
MAREFGPNTVESSRKQIGHGKAFTGMGSADVAAALIDKIQCDAGQMPTLWQVRSHWQGPMSDTAVKEVFQPQTDILALGRNVPGAAATSVTQGLTNSELQTASLICGVFVHISANPFIFSIPGVSVPNAAFPSANGIVAPDTWTQQDIVGTPSALGPAAAQAALMRRASMDLGRWAQEGAWAMCKAFNFIWSYGDKTTLLDWPLRYMAWMPPQAESGSAGTGAVDVTQYAAAMNAYYAQQGASQSFLIRNARRTGSVTVGAAPVSTFSPDDSFRMAQPFIGGLSLREGLDRNTEYFMLPRPVLFPRGVALGMYLNQKDAVAFSEMQAQFSITNGAGLNTPPVTSIPPVDTDGAPGETAGFPTGAAASPTFLELTKDAVPVTNALQVRTDSAIYKWGDLYIGIGAIGYELTQAQYDYINQNSGDISGALAAAGCPCHIL